MTYESANKPFTASPQTLLPSPHLTSPLVHHVHVHRGDVMRGDTQLWLLEKHLTQIPSVFGILTNVLRTIQP